MATRRAEVVFVGDAKSIVRAAQQATGAVRKTGTAAETSGRKMENVHLRMRKSFGGLTASATKMAGGVAAAYASFEGVKKSVDATENLAKATLGLHKTFGLSIADASRWAGVMKARGVDSKALNQAFGTLSKNAVAVGVASAKQGKALDGLGASQADLKKRIAITSKSLGPQADAFKALGLSTKDVQGANKDFQGFLGKVSDGMKKLPGGADKAAISMKLFGKGWQTVVPMLRGGSKAMNDQLALADKYGITLKGKTVKSIEELTQAQRESKMASLGLQVAIGTTLIPTITKGVQTVSAFVANLRNGGGGFAEFRDMVKSAVAEVKADFEALKAVAVPAIQKVVEVFRALPQHAKSAVMAVAALGAVFLATGPWGLAVAAVVGGVILIKRNWGTIGPIFNAVKDAAVSAFNGVVGAVRTATNWLTQAFQNTKRDISSWKVAWAVVGVVVAYVKTEFAVLKAIVTTEIKAAVAIFKFILPTIVTAARSAFAGLKQVIRGGMQVIRGFVEIVRGILKGDFGKIWAGIKDMVGGALKMAWGVIRGQTAVARAAMSRIGGAIVGVLHGLGSRFVELGKNLVQGLINGIGSMVGALKDKVTGIAGGAIKWFKDKIGAKSPSRVFHGIGQDTMQGYINGLLSKKEALAAGLKGSLLFPIDAAIQALNDKKDQLQKAWDAIDARAQRSELVAAVRHPSGGSLGGSGGGSSSGSSASLKGLPKGGGNSVARTALAVAKRMGASSKQTLALVEAGIVESGMRNLSFGDRDSVGFLQQRPSQGWKGLRNVPKAAAEFLSHAKGKKSGGMTAGQLAQSVQGSAFPARYDAVKGKAQALIRSLGGGGGSGGSGAAASKEIARNEQKIYDLRKKTRDLPAGKAHTAERKQIQDEIAALLKRNKTLKATVKGSSALADAKKALKDFDTQAKRAAKSAKFDLQIKNLAQLQAFKDAIKGARGQMKDLASQAAQAWRAIQEKGINKTHDAATTAAEKAHDAAIAAINGGADAQELARLTAQDAAEQDAKTTEQLDKDLSDAKASGDKKAIKDAEDAIAAYKRGKREEELTANITKNTTKADDDLTAAKTSADNVQQAALDGLDQQTADYEAGLNAQFSILGTQLENRKIAYATWAKEVNGILSTYGLGVDVDPASEAAITAGPGAAAPPLFYVVGNQHGAGAYPGKPDSPIKVTSSKPQGKPKGKAVGGWTYPGQDYWVGETGPERFTPAVRGHITPASRSGSGSRSGGGVTIGEVHIHNGTDLDRMTYRLARALR